MSHFMMAYVGIDVNWEMVIHLSSVSSISQFYADDIPEGETHAM